MRRENNEITYLRPDSKSQVTIEYDDDNSPVRIDAIVISKQHFKNEQLQYLLNDVYYNIQKIWTIYFNLIQAESDIKHIGYFWEYKLQKGFRP